VAFAGRGCLAVGYLLKVPNRLHELADEFEVSTRSIKQQESKNEQRK
jgi:hypothetical protein